MATRPAAERTPGIDASTIVDREMVVLRTGGAEEGMRAEAPMRARVFEIIRTTQLDPYQSTEAAAFEAREERVRAAGDVFGGTRRAVAKIKIVRAALERFAHLGELLDSLPSDAAMKRLRIPRDESSDRVREEKRNVRIDAFLWAAKREGDNDYHVILGRAGRKPTRFMNVEISGLPKTPTRDTPRLRAVRRTFEDMVRPTRLGLPGTGGYDFYNPPFRVTVQGSLFFDIEHVDDKIGPADARARTAWEIHPLSALEFIDDGQARDALVGLDAETIVDVTELPGTARRMVIRTTQRDP